MTRWAILTGEYPPDRGGVSDYSRLVARGLVAAGDEVEVFAPKSREDGPDPDDCGVTVHRLPGHFGPRSLALLDHQLTRSLRPDRILVQYVPHAFGYKAMNLPFASWVATRARRIAPVWAMFHEVMFPFRWRPVTFALLGTVTRVMARLLAGAADRVFVSIPRWGPILEGLCPRAKPAEWLPVPCTLESNSDAAEAARARTRLAPAGGRLVGHFGTYGSLIAEMLEAAVIEMLRLTPNTSMAFIGRGSEDFRRRFEAEHPTYVGRVASSNDLHSAAVSAHLQACDLLMQPFPDGVSSRRTSAMAVLANGIPLVTNLGALSEPFWVGNAVAVAPSPDALSIAQLAVKLLDDPPARMDLGRRGADLYRNTFALEHTISRLRGQAG